MHIIATGVAEMCNMLIVCLQVMFYVTVSGKGASASDRVGKSTVNPRDKLTEDCYNELVVTAKKLGTIGCALILH